MGFVKVLTSKRILTDTTHPNNYYYDRIFAMLLDDDEVHLCDGKSIHDTLLISKVTHHISLELMRIGTIQIPISYGYTSHFRKEIPARYVDKSYSIQNLIIDWNYLNIITNRTIETFVASNTNSIEALQELLKEDKNYIVF